MGTRASILARSLMTVFGLVSVPGLGHLAPPADAAVWPRSMTPEFLARTEASSLEAGLDAIVLKLQAALSGRSVKRVAVLPLSRLTGGTSELGAHVADKLTSRLYDSAQPYTVVDRMNIDSAIRELEFNYSRLVEPETAKRLGKFLGADAIVTGTIAEIERSFDVTIRLLNTEELTILGTAEALVARNSTTAKMWAKPADVSRRGSDSSAAPSADPATKPDGRRPGLAGKLVALLSSSSDSSRGRGSAGHDSYSPDRFASWEAAEATVAAGALRPPGPGLGSPRVYLAPGYRERSSADLVPVYVHTRQTPDFQMTFRDQNGYEFSAPVNGCSSRDGNGTYFYVPAGTTLNFRFPGSGWDSNVLEINPFKTGWAKTPHGQKVAKVLGFEHYGAPNCP